MDAKVWFQKYSDDGIEHEYLVTEGYLWTGQYPECGRVITRGNNQSMELDERFIKADWTKDANGDPEFFIINEAIMSKLCILGENVEPCFEGSQINRVEFSFDEGFKKELFTFMKLMQENLNEGGAPVFTIYSVTVGDALWTNLYNAIDHEAYAIEGVFEDGEQKFAVLKNREDNTYNRMNFNLLEDGAIEAEEMVAMEDYVPAEEAQFALADVEAFEAEFKKKDKEEKDEEKKPAEGEDKAEDSEEDSDEDKKKKKKSKGDEEDFGCKKKNYNLDEVVEYAELQGQYDELNQNYSNAQARIAELETLVNELTEFKNKIDRKEKEALINEEFCMLDAEDKKDVIENIDKYSLDDIEAKLAVIAVRKKVNFNLNEDDEHKEDKDMTFNLDDAEEDNVPAWVKAVQATAKSMNE